LLISLINIMLPVIIKTFSTSVELPLSLSEQQSSILAKLVLARCVNTAVLLYDVTNYTELFADTTMASTPRELAGVGVTEADLPKLFSLFSFTLLRARHPRRRWRTLRALQFLRLPLLQMLLRLLLLLPSRRRRRRWKSQQQQQQHQQREEV